MEKKKRKRLLKKYIVLPTIIVFVIQIIYCFKQKFASLTLWTSSIIGDIVIYVIIVNKNINNTLKEVQDYKKKSNEINIIECIKRNVLIGAKEIIEETNMADRTVRRI